MGSDSTPRETMYSRREDLERFTQDQFAFLSAKRGFVETLGEHSAMFTVIYFAKKSLGLKLALDYRDQTVYPDLIRLSNGARPKVGYIVDDQVVRIPLFVLFDDLLNIEDKQIAALSPILSTGMLDFQAAADAVMELRQVIERYVDMLEAQPLEKLFPSVEVFQQVIARK